MFVFSFSHFLVYKLQVTVLFFLFQSQTSLLILYLHLRLPLPLLPLVHSSCWTKVRSANIHLQMMHDTCSFEIECKFSISPSRCDYSGIAATRAQTIPIEKRKNTIEQAKPKPRLMTLLKNWENIPSSRSGRKWLLCIGLIAKHAHFGKRRSVYFRAQLVSLPDKREKGLFSVVSRTIITSATRAGIFSPQN